MKSEFNLDKSLPAELDIRDSLSGYRDQFHFPKGMDGRNNLYFCGNSLGLQPKAAADDIRQVMSDWARLAVRGHSTASVPWMEYQNPLKLQMAKVVGADHSEIAIGNTLTANLHFMMASFFRPAKNRFKILFENKCFPSDRYVISSQLKFHGFDPAEGMVEVISDQNGYLLKTEDFIEAIDRHRKELALILLGGINYYTGQLYDLKAIAAKARESGISIGLDLAHVAGNIPVQLSDLEVDFACWCTYKYLNGGPGSLSAFYVNKKHFSNPDLPRLEGWWGNRLSSRFQMRRKIDTWDDAEKWIVSNPPILALAPLVSSLKMFEAAGMPALREKSIKLTAYLEYLIHTLGDETIELITPSESYQRGCQLSMLVKNGNRKVYKQLSDHGVIVDWREPGVVRVAPVPFYNSFSEIYRFYEIFKTVLNKSSE